MERRERSRSSYTPSSDTPSDDDMELSEADLANWRTQMRWLIPFVQATGHRIIIDNPKSHEQIIIDHDTKELPSLSLEWMQKYNNQELLEWLAKEKEKQLKEEEERQTRLQVRRLAEIRGRERFGNSFTLEEEDTKGNTNNSQSNNTKGIRNYFLPLLCFYIILLIFIGIGVYNGPVYESERRDKEMHKYYTIMKEAENSSVKELITPEGFRFDMNEDKFNAINEQRKSHVVDNITKYDWLFSNVHYSGDKIYGEEFYEGKLCSYYLKIEGKIRNGSLIKLDDYDVKRICEYYKVFFEKDYTFKEFPELRWGRLVYVFTKSNMVITLS